MTHNCSVGSVRVARTSGAFERLTTDLVAPNSVHDIPRRGPNNMKTGTAVRKNYLLSCLPEPLTGPIMLNILLKYYNKLH